MKFSNEFKAVCKKKKLRIQDAADTLGVTRQHLSNVINGNTDAGNVLARDIVQFSDGEIELDLVLGSRTRIINDCAVK